jgi:cell division septation protein DedD
MSYEFELDHKKTTVLVGVFFLLIFLVFVAGWLSGALFGIPDGDTPPSPAPMPRTPPLERPATVAVKINVPPAPEPEPENAFSVQVGAFRTAEKARDLGLALREKGHSPYVYQGMNSKGQAWFTVRIGDHVEYAEAVSAAESFQENEATAAVVTHIDTLSVVRTPDGSLPADRKVLNGGERIDLADIPRMDGSVPETPDDTASDAGTGQTPAAGPDVIEDEDDSTASGTDDTEATETVAALSAEAEGGAGVSGTPPPLVPETGEKSDVADPDNDEEPAAAAPVADQDDASGSDGGVQAKPERGENVGDPGPADEKADLESSETDLLSESGGDASKAVAMDADAMDGPGKFSVQVGAFLNPKNAHRLADKLRESGYAAYVFDVEDAGGKTWHAVRADDYGDVKTALAAAGAFQEKEAVPVMITPIDSLTVVAIPGGVLPGDGPGGSTGRLLVGKTAPAPVETRDGACTHSLRLASFRSHEAASQAVSVYRRRGLPAFFFSLTDKGGDPFRLVQMGCYDSFAAAASAKAAFHVPRAVIKKTPWANLVGAYAERTAAEEKVLELETAGFSPYIRDASDGSCKVMAGAFSSRETAETHGRDLEAQGFHNTVVAR